MFSLPIEQRALRAERCIVLRSGVQRLIHEHLQPLMIGTADSCDQASPCRLFRPIAGEVAQRFWVLARIDGIKQRVARLLVARRVAAEESHESFGIKQLSGIGYQRFGLLQVAMSFLEVPDERVGPGAAFENAGVVSFLSSCERILVDGSRPTAQTSQRISSAIMYPRGLSPSAITRV